MRKQLAIFVLSLLATAAAAQEDPYRMMTVSSNNDVEIRATKQGDDEIILTAYKNKPGKYSIYVEFNKHSNLGNIRDVFTVIENGTTELIRYKIDPQQGAPGFSYSYYPGVVNGRVKTDFAYRLPFEDGTKRDVKIFSYDTPEKRGGGNEIMEHVAYAFTASEGDDVYAMRKGKVSKIEDTQWFLQGVADDKVLRKANKQVCVQHDDGSAAYYTGIQDGTLNVAVDEMVYPDTKLGKAGTLNEQRYEIRVSVDYLTAPMKGTVPDFKNVKRNIVTPWFLTGSGKVQLTDGTEYECVVTDELINGELSKREQRNRNKK